MSAVETVAENMKALVPEQDEDREDFARRMFYLQMEIYSAHAGTTLYRDGDFEWLPVKVRKSWLAKADKKLTEIRTQ